MSVKAVYASKTIAIYITGNDVDKLLQGNIVLGPMIAANETIAEEGIDVRMTVPGIRALRPIRDTEMEGYGVVIQKTWTEYVKRVGKERFR